MIFVTENFKAKNHFQIETIQCYVKKKGFEFHLFNLNKTKACNQTVEFYRRHCILADTMKEWGKNDFAYLMDSDVIAHDYKAQCTNEKSDKSVEDGDRIFARW